LENSGLIQGDISYINAHGTATQNNDLSEGIAIERLFSNGVPAVSSTKSMTGHLLGASGAIEAGVSIISILNNIIPANLNFKTKMKELAFTPVTELKKGVKINHVMSNSFGFGGNNTSLIFSKC
jgi:3-oxoacyl-[acyl-carrier-protein] synthase-1